MGYLKQNDSAADFSGPRAIAAAVHAAIGARYRGANTAPPPAGYSTITGAM